MFFFALLLIIEFLIVGLLTQPTLQTDTTALSIIMLTFNTIVLSSLLNNAIKGNDNDKKLNSYLLLSLFLHLVVLLLDVYARDYFILPNAEGDAIWYEIFAQKYAFGSKSNLIVLNDYQFWCGLIYKCIGVQRITIQFINIYLALFAIILIYKCTIMLKIDYEWRKKMLLFMCFMPNLLIITSIFLRESLIAFCIATSIFFYTKWWYEDKIYYLLFAFLFSIVGGVFHVGGAACAAGYIATMFLVGNPQREICITGNSMFKMASILVVMLIALSFSKDALLAKTGGELSAEVIVSKAGQTDRVSDADYNIGIQGLSPIPDLIVNSPIRMFYFLSAPAPWMWRGIKDILAFWGSAFFYLYVTWQLIVYFKNLSLSKNLFGGTGYLFVFSVVILVATLMFGWGVSNTGTALRHREKFTYLFCLLYAITAQHKSTRSK